jgi:hypothetical protein
MPTIKTPTNSIAQEVEALRKEVEQRIAPTTKPKVRLRFIRSNGKGLPHPDDPVVGEMEIELNTPTVH